jgi:hypothetical protein
MTTTVSGLVGGVLEAAFAPSREAYRVLEAAMASSEARAMRHEELEEHLAVTGRELLRELYQSNLRLRSLTEVRAPVVADAEGIGRNRIERGNTRGLATVFGPVTVTRFAYRGEFVASLYVQDASLNLPAGKHSHGIAKMAADYAVRDSFAEATERIRAATGIRVGKRQVEQLAVAAARDIEAFYQAQIPLPAGAGTALVLTFDGKGIVMRPDALRPATAKAAVAKGANTYGSRLGPGEKHGRKRMAEIAAVYDADPEPRIPADILPEPDDERERAMAPVAFNKWLSGSVEQDAAEVVRAAFDQAHARDPLHARDWVVLVDGNNHQIELAKTQAGRRKKKVTVIVDFIHVLEYLWKAAWCLYRSPDPEAELFVAAYGRQLLEGNTAEVIARLDQAARDAGLTETERAGIDTAIGYLQAKAPYLRYDQALAKGWPIATGIIEGACRHLVKDRMDITGARWSLAGAEAVLRLRALRSNGDFNAYWTYHTAQEHYRNHQLKYKDAAIPENC